MYKLIVFVPKPQKESLKSALFAAGGGRFRNYDRCSWECPGVGQFRPLDDATPFLGNAGTVERVAEYRLEMICDEASIKDVLAALIQNHPYEEPAYEVVKILTAPDFADAETLEPSRAETQPES